MTGRGEKNRRKGRNRRHPPRGPDGIYPHTYGNQDYENPGGGEIDPYGGENDGPAETGTELNRYEQTHQDEIVDRNGQSRNRAKHTAEPSGKEYHERREMNREFGPQYPSDYSGDGPTNTPTRTVHVPKDGDCLFHCLAEGLAKGTDTADRNTTQSDVRESIANHYESLTGPETNNERLNIMTGSESAQEAQANSAMWKDRVRRTRTSATTVEGRGYGTSCWGTDTECAAFANIHNTVVIVRKRDTERMEIDNEIIEEDAEYWTMFKPNAERAIAAIKRNRGSPRWTWNNHSLALTTKARGTQLGEPKTVVLELNDMHYDILTPMNDSHEWSMAEEPINGTPTPETQVDTHTITILSGDTRRRRNEEPTGHSPQKKMPRKSGKENRTATAPTNPEQRGRTEPTTQPEKQPRKRENTGENPVKQDPRTIAGDTGRTEQRSRGEIEQPHTGDGEGTHGPATEGQCDREIYSLWCQILTTAADKTKGKQVTDERGKRKKETKKKMEHTTWTYPLLVREVAKLLERMKETKIKLTTAVDTMQKLFRCDPKTADHNLRSSPRTNAARNPVNHATDVRNPNANGTQESIFKYTMAGVKPSWYIAGNNEEIEGLGAGWTEQRIREQDDSEEVHTCLTTAHPCTLELENEPNQGNAQDTEPQRNKRKTTPEEETTDEGDSAPDETQRKHTQTYADEDTAVLLSWNARSLYAAAPTLASTNTRKYQIVAVVDTRLHPASHKAAWIRRAIPGKVIYFNSWTKKGTPAHAGVLTAIPTEMEKVTTQLPFKKGSMGRILAIRVCAEEVAETIIVAYAPHPSSETEQDGDDERLDPVKTHEDNLRKEIEQALERGDDVTLAGDHNATTKQSDRTNDMNDRDRRWARLLEELNMHEPPQRDEGEQHSFRADQDERIASRIDNWFFHTQNTYPPRRTGIVTNWAHNSDHDPVWAETRAWRVPKVTAADKDWEPAPIDRIKLPKEENERHQITETVREETGPQIDRLREIVNQDQLQPDDLLEAELIVNECLETGLKCTEETCGRRVTVLKHRKDGDRPWMPRAVMKKYKKHMGMAKRIRALNTFVLNRPNMGPTDHDTATQLAGLAHTPLPETTGTANTDEWATQNRTKIAEQRKLARQVCDTHQTKDRNRFQTRWQKLLDERRKIGHRCIFTKGEPKHDLAEVLMEDGTTSAKKQHILQAVTDHFTKVQTATLSPDPAAVRDYPWEKDGMRLAKKGDTSPMMQAYSKELYYEHVRKLPTHKAPGPDEVPNEVLRLMPHEFHECLADLMRHIGNTGHTPNSWKTSNTILLYKKGDPRIVKNHRPIALARTVYKLWTSMVTTMMSDYAEDRGMLHSSQEGFRRHRNTERQLQVLVGLLEDAKLSKQDIWVLYIDFTNAFGSVDHPRLLAILEDLGFPEDTVRIVKNLYTDARTTFTTPAGRTEEVPLHRGNIQGDALSPLVFLCFIEPLLRWLENDPALGYSCGTSNVKAAAAAYADDLACVSNNAEQMGKQLKKLEAFEGWAQLEVNNLKCALTANLNKTGKSIAKDRATIKRVSNRLTYGGKPFPILAANEPYRYLGVLVTANLKWTHQKNAITKTLVENSNKLTSSWATKPQQDRSIREVIDAQARYGMAVAPYSSTDMVALGAVVRAAVKKAKGLPRFMPTAFLYNSTDEFGVGVRDMLEDYEARLVDSLREALQDEGRLGKVTTGLAKHYHMNGIRAATWMTMGPVARKLSTVWQAGMGLAGNLPQRPRTLTALRGKKVDNGWGWGIMTQLTDAQIAPLIDIGALTIDLMATRNGEALMGVADFSKAFKGAKARHIRAYRKVREALCVYTGNEDRPATLLEANTVQARRSQDTFREAWERISGERGQENNHEIHVHVAKKRKTKKGRQDREIKTDIEGPPNPEPVVAIHRVRKVGAQTQYEVEWDKSWTDGSNVEPSPNHDIREGKFSDNAWRVTEIHDTRTTENDDNEYLVSWERTWEPAHLLIPHGERVSQLISDFYATKWREADTGEAPRQMVEKTETQAEDAPTTDTRELNRLLKICLTDTNPDADTAPTGEAWLQAAHKEGEGRVVIARDKEGRMAGQLTEDRVEQLWMRYCAAQRREQPDSFPEEIVRLLNRYKTGRKAKTAATGKMKMTNHWTLPDEYMAAVKHTLGACRERFASPLNVSWDTTEYWTAYKRDRVFGAHHDAYSTLMTGMSEANPEYETEELYEALKRAIQSTYTEAPACTLMVYPDWDGESYQKLMKHPRVHILHRVPQPHFSFDTPTKFTGQRDKTAHNAHWDVMFFVVANKQGLEMAHMSRAKDAFQEADIDHCGKAFPVTPPGPAEVARMEQEEHRLSHPPEGIEARPPNGALSPREYAYAEAETGVQSQLTYESVRTLATAHDVYTDGSLKTASGKSGAAYVTTDGTRRVAIRYTGRQTILRAEMVAILATLKDTDEDEPLHLYSDSLTSLQNIQKVVWRKGDARGVKESPLAKDIFRELHKRRAPTLLAKVRAHVGIRGNEDADRTAVGAADGKLTKGAKWLDFTTPDEHHEGEIWISTDGATPGKDPAAQAREYRKGIRVEEERAKAHKDYCRMSEIPTVDHKPSNAFAKSTTVTAKDRAWVWKARSNAVATGRRMKLWGKLPTGETGLCVVCHQAEDTVGHRLGGCEGEVLAGMHTHRHDAAVKTIVGAVRRAARGGWHTEYNAGKQTDGSTVNMIKDCFLKPRPGCRIDGDPRMDAPTEAALLKLKPDVITYQGIRPGELDATLARLQRGTARRAPMNIKLQILELGYCNDWKWEEKVEEKAQAYRALVAHMTRMKWRVEYKQVAVGVRGCVFDHLHDVLKWMGMKEPTARKRLARTLALHGARTAAHIMRTYERIRRTPAGEGQARTDGGARG